MERACGGDAVNVADTLNNIGLEYAETKDWEKAKANIFGAYGILEGLDEAKLKARELKVLDRIENNLAMVLVELNCHEEAIQHYHTTLERKQKMYGPRHPKVGDALYNIAEAHDKYGDFRASLNEDEQMQRISSVQMYEEAKEIYVNAYGEDDDETIDAIAMIKMAKSKRDAKVQ